MLTNMMRFRNRVNQVTTDSAMIYDRSIQVQSVKKYQAINANLTTTIIAATANKSQLQIPSMK